MNPKIDWPIKGLMVVLALFSFSMMLNFMINGFTRQRPSPTLQSPALQPPEVLLPDLPPRNTGEPEPLPDHDKYEPRIITAAPSVYAKYIDEKELPKGFKAKDYPFITIDGVKLWHDPNLPGWEKNGGGYRTVLYNVSVGWADFGDGLELAETDFRSDDESLYGAGKQANVDGDIMVRHREGLVEIMDGGKWRIIRPGDKLRPAAAEQMINTTKTEKLNGKIVSRVGTSNLWARLGDDGAWVIINRETDDAPKLSPHEGATALDRLDRQ